MLRHSLVNLASVVALLIALAAGNQASAIGYWNMPGSVCQCAGYGWGAGYHAKFVLGPITAYDCCAHNEVRLPYAPQPPYACYGQYGCGCRYGQPSLLAPSDVPAESPTTTYEPISPTAAEQEPMSAPSMEPEPVELESESSPGADTSAPPPPSPLPRAVAPSRPLFDAPVEP